ncbi:MAG TPA: NBR1-Ig-like domain-containing protein, partial [Anaerolineales bacterium]|nr:NBR1-Ig-like domain-containing protein [Anaerolineales bacterium]
MNKKSILTFIILAGLMLSACNGSPPAVDVSTPASTDTDVPPASTATATQTQTAEETPAPSTFVAESTPTPEPPRPTNEPNCTNSAAFVADVTIPDNTTMAAGTTFTKTWQILNTGTCIWASDYSLGYYSDDNMGAPDSVPLSITYPGQTADISVLLTAPNSVGTHRGNFVVRNPEGLIMQINEDSRLWV